MLPVYVTEDEKRIIDGLRDKMQLVTRNKVSRADAILKAISFSSGQMPLK
jgi:hypothetical protein